MTRADRRASIQRILAGRPDVPSVRAMAKLVGTSWPSIARDYRALRIAGTSKTGRPATGQGVPITIRLEPAVFDHYDRLARARRIPLATAIRVVLTARTTRERPVA
jgi:predicted DNA-binding transcriptional regulator YafY